MAGTATMPKEEAQIRARIDAIAEGIRAKDVNALMAQYAPDCVIFDLMPLQTLGRDAYRRNFEGWFSSVQGSIGFTIRELRIAVSGRVAYCHYLAHVTGTRTTGESIDYPVRVTAGIQLLNNQWLIVHEHVSLPFPSMERMQAATASAGKS